LAHKSVHEIVYLNYRYFYSVALLKRIISFMKKGCQALNIFMIKLYIVFPQGTLNEPKTHKKAH
jgi:hypothetical protein